MFNRYLINLIINHLHIKTYISYLIQGQTATAIWSGNFLVLYSDLGRQWSGIGKGQFYFVLVCFVLVWCYSCVYNTNETMKVLFTDSVSTTAVMDLLYQDLVSTQQDLVCSTCYSYNSYNIYTLFTRILGLVI